MPAIQLAALAQEDLAQSKQFYIADLEAMSQDDLGFSPGGAARTAFDFTYEVAVINRRLACRLRGEDPGPFPFKMGSEWAKAPADYCRKQVAIEDFAASMDEVIAAVGDDPERDVQLPDKVQSAYEIAKFCCTHVNYHLAQLNYIQSMRGDAEMHWFDA